MSPSPRSPRGDARWRACGRAASAGTLALHAGVLLGLLFTQGLVHHPTLPPLPAGVVALELRPEPAPPPAAVTMPEPVAPAPAVPAPVEPRREAPPPRPAPRPKPERVAPRHVASPVQPAPVTMAPDEAQDAAPAPDEASVSAPATAQAGAARGMPAPGHSRGVDMTEATPMQRVLAALAELVERHKEYPRAARRAGYQGTVLMEVTLRGDGVIGNFGLAEGSAHSLLDKATERAFARMQGMRVAGVTLPGEVRVRVPVRYELH